MAPKLLRRATRKPTRYRGSHSTGLRWHSLAPSPRSSAPANATAIIPAHRNRPPRPTDLSSSPHHLGSAMKFVELKNIAITRAVTPTRLSTVAQLRTPSTRPATRSWAWQCCRRPPPGASGVTGATTWAPSKVSTFDFAVQCATGRAAALRHLGETGQDVDTVRLGDAAPDRDVALAALARSGLPGALSGPVLCYWRDDLAGDHVGGTSCCRLALDGDHCRRRGDPSRESALERQAHRPVPERLGPAPPASERQTLRPRAAPGSELVPGAGDQGSGASVHMGSRVPRPIRPSCLRAGPQGRIGALPESGGSTCL
ncbi:hypothetical protein ABH941_005911 [Streptacidiphilus sp. EB103A]